ncbi:MAG TPA: TRAP transporter large permease [Rhodobacteraceae bacterium]|nr:TRAP transporter large permease [Alphaproteobacteria bacterium]MDG0982721.1 TRAP transporter large permease [Tateyamaria sp.]HAB39219.1 TRAP transporter large permease [Paracoccaceae bacterium]MDG1421143.1 TRAP transporter large permease [Tateyamaria sp.]MDG1679217.1 TRAP transporter large permease [Tateyamaria sp.]
MLLWFLPLFLVFLLVGLPVFFGLLAAPGLLLWLNGQEKDITLLYRNVYNGMDSFPLMAIPFFMLAGELMNKGGITIRLVQISQALMGHLRGGLAQVNVLSSILFAGLSGSAVADTSALGSMLIPAMEKEGYTRRFAAAITAASSVIGPIIPPSGIMIIYAYVMGESVAALFLAGIVPGILVGVGLMVMVRLTADHYDLPEAKRVAFDGVELGNLEKWVSFLLIRLNLGLVIWAIIPMPKTSVLLLWVSFLASVVIIHALLLALRTQVSNEFRMICKRAVVPLQTPVLILGGILGGIFTPTEAAAVAVAYAIFVAFFVLRTMSLKDLPDILSRAGLTSAVVLLLVGAAMAFKTVVALSYAPQLLADYILTLSENPLILLFLINLLLFFVGMFLDAGPAIIILGPILAPIFTDLGVDPIHFAIIMSVNLTVGLATPPMGLVLFVAAAVSQEKVETISKAILPFLLVEIAVIFLITYVPAISMTIPRLTGFAN